MTSSYTTNKSIEKPANGDYVNTWSTPVNTDWDIIDKAFGGRTSLNAVGASGTVVLTSTQYQAPIILITGALTANVTYQIPSTVGGCWYVYNNTSGAYTITLSSGGGGTSLVLSQGYTTSAICDGTNVGRADTATALTTSSYADPTWITSLAASKLTGTVAVVNGGTAGTTAATARTNLGAAASGTNTDITTLDPTGGLQVGTPTGGAQGSGTINAAAMYVNGVAVGTSTGTVSSVAMTVPTFLSISGTPITTSGTLAVSLSGTALPVANGGTGGTTAAAARTALGAGTVTSASVVSANGFAGTVATATTTPAITLTTSITGVLKGNGTAISAATAGTDYVAPSGALGTPSSGTLSSCTVDGTNNVGFRNVPQSGSDKTTSYTLLTSDVGKFIGVGTSGSITIPNSTFAAGDIISLFNNTTGNITITCTITTAYIGGVNTAKSTMTLATRGVATILFISGTVCVVNGNVS